MMRARLPLSVQLQRDAERVYNLILHSDMEWPDIALQINEIREVCRERMPDKVELFDQIYGGRFERLWQQWRLQGDTSWTWRDSPPPSSF